MAGLFHFHLGLGRAISSGFSRSLSRSIARHEERRIARHEAREARSSSTSFRGGRGFDIWIEVRGDEALERRFRGLALGLQDLRSFWPLVVPLATSWWRKQFETEGGFGGAPWAPLAFSTVQRKARLGLRPEILQATGDMKAAASRPSRIATPRSLTLSIDDPKLPFHQEGTSKMPARPLIFERLPGPAERDIENAAEEYVEELVRHATRGSF